MNGSDTVPITAEQMAELVKLSGRVAEQRPHQQELRFPSGRRFVAPLPLPEIPEQRKGDES